MKRTHLPKAPPASSASIRASMQGNKSSKTKPELKFKEELERAGFNYFSMNQRDIPGSPDFVFSAKKLAIFVHGCFWHRCPYCNPHFPDSNQEYWKAKFIRNKARDIRVRRELRSQGWKPKVVWECILKKRPGYVIAQIRKHLEITHE